MARNHRNHAGEIDLVAVEDRRTIVFVEVKSRRRVLPDEHPAVAIDRRKIRRLTRAATVFLSRNQLLGRPARFDVITVVWPPAARRPTIEHFRNAFDADWGPNR